MVCFSDDLFPAYGFGARIPPGNLVSHNFPLVICRTFLKPFIVIIIIISFVDITGPTTMTKVSERV